MTEKKEPAVHYEYWDYSTSVNVIRRPFIKTACGIEVPSSEGHRTTYQPDRVTCGNCHRNRYFIVNAQLTG